MARLIPTDPVTAASSAGERAEQETLRSFTGALPDAFTIFHGVRWANESDRGTADEPVEALVDAGFAPEDIVLLSVHGFRKSILKEAGSAGGYPLRRFTEQYSDDGHQRYTSGQSLFDSVYRFKGQEAPAVVLTDIDFDDWRGDR